MAESLKCPFSGSGKADSESFLLCLQNKTTSEILDAQETLFVRDTTVVKNSIRLKTKTVLKRQKQILAVMMVENI